MASTESEDKTLEDFDKYFEENNERLSLKHEKIEKNVDINGETITIIHKIYIEKPYTYSESKKKAIKKYQEKNKEKITEYTLNYKNNKYATDPEFRERQKEYNKRSYERRKSKILQNK